MKKISLSLMGVALSALISPQAQSTKPTSGPSTIEPERIVYDLDIVEGSSFNSREANQIRSVLSRELSARLPGHSVIKTVRDTLARRYGSIAQETPRGAANYYWRWNDKDEVWVLVCVVSTAFTVNLTTGPVVIEVSEGMPL